MGGYKTKDKMDLSPLQMQIYKRVVKGESNKEIAEFLGKSERAIKNSMSGLMFKMGVDSRARLIVQYFKNSGRDGST